MHIMHLSTRQKSAFSTLEVVLVILILGILGFGAIKAVNVNLSQGCIKILRNDLAIAQERVSMIYLRSLLMSDFERARIISSVNAVFENLQRTTTRRNKRCNFVYFNSASLGLGALDSALDYAGSTSASVSFANSIPATFAGTASLGLRANIYDDYIDFTIEPNDLSINPKIYCSYSSELCRRFFNRILTN